MNQFNFVKKNIPKIGFRLFGLFKHLTKNSPAKNIHKQKTSVSLQLNCVVCAYTNTTEVCAIALATNSQTELKLSAIIKSRFVDGDKQNGNFSFIAYTQTRFYLAALALTLVQLYCGIFGRIDKCVHASNVIILFVFGESVHLHGNQTNKEIIFQLSHFTVHIL